jgi:translation machinery-associated protein 16
MFTKFWSIEMGSRGGTRRERRDEVADRLVRASVLENPPKSRRLQRKFASPKHCKMPSKLSKVHKQIAKKKGDKIKSLHENSRDARRLRNAGARDDRVARLSAVREKANRQFLDRIAFFQDRLPETLHPMQTKEIQALIEDYLSRHKEEIEELKAERRPGRPASTRQTLLEQKVKLEDLEYDSGLWLPNLQDEETLVKLDKWTGEWVGLGVMRFLRVDRAGAVKESQFPPRGAS